MKIFLYQKLEEESISYLFAAICIILIPIYTWYIPPFLGLWFIARISEIWFNRIKKSTISIVSSTLKLSLLFVFFFFFQVIGLFYSENLQNGLNIVLSRLSLLFIPILFISPGKYINSHRTSLLNFFAYATTLYICYCFAFALFRSVHIYEGNIILNPHPAEAYWLSYFFGSYFSVYQHPTYLAIYVNLSILICLESIVNSELKTKGRSFWMFLMLVLFTSLFFLSSRTAFILIFIIIPIYIYFKLRVINKFKIVIVITLLFLIIGFAMIRTNERFEYYYEQITEGSIKEKLAKDSRIMIWKSSLKIIKENILFGVGIGDVRDELMKKYYVLGNKDLIESRYNAHNQFLEITIEGGLLSLTAFLGIIVYMAYNAVRQQNTLLAFFVLIMLFFFMFETVLYRLSGLIFFTYLSFILLQNIKSKS